MKEQRQTINISRPPSSKDLSSVVKRTVQPTETQIRQRACELHLARDRHGHALTPCPPNPGKTSIRTLLVDDSPLMLKILTQILAKEGGFTVVGAALNGRQALQYAATLSPDLILMDFEMPHLNGAEATRYIKQFADPPIIFMVTSDDNSIFRMMSKTAGADAFIVKSGDLPAQLKTKLRECFPKLPLTADSGNPDGLLRRRLVWRVQRDSMEGVPPCHTS